MYAFPAIDGTSPVGKYEQQQYRGGRGRPRSHRQIDTFRIYF